MISIFKICRLLFTCVCSQILFTFLFTPQLRKILGIFRVMFKVVKKIRIVRHVRLATENLELLFLYINISKQIKGLYCIRSRMKKKVYKIKIAIHFHRPFNGVLSSFKWLKNLWITWHSHMIVITCASSEARHKFRFAPCFFFFFTCASSEARHKFRFARVFYLCQQRSAAQV